MKILVCGGRDYDNYQYIRGALNAILSLKGRFTLIQGGAKGADSLASKWAKKRGLTELKFKADWDKHGRSAGHIRNNKMLKEGKPDLVVAFPGGVGTQNMVDIAKKAGVEVIEL